MGTLHLVSQFRYTTIFVTFVEFLLLVTPTVVDCINTQPFSRLWLYPNSRLKGLPNTKYTNNLLQCMSLCSDNCTEILTLPEKGRQLCVLLEQGGQSNHISPADYGMDVEVWKKGIEVIWF